MSAIRNVWKTELTVVAGAAVVLLLAGAIAGRPAAFLATGLIAYAGWHAIQLARLLRWLDRGRKLAPPEAPGLWGEVFDQIYRLQQRNRKRKRQLAAIIDRFSESAAALPDATVVIDEEGRIEWFNDSARELLDLASTDTGRQLANLVRHPDFVRYLAAGDYARPLDIPAPGHGDRMLVVRVVPYGRDRRLVVARDVTRVRQLEQMRKDFVANVSHELRTPLTVLGGYLDALGEQGPADAAEWKSVAGPLMEQTRRMQRIVEDLLQLSRLEAGVAARTDAPVDVDAMARSIADEARRVSGGGSRIEIESEAGLSLLGQADDLRSAFTNLVMNAVRYTPAGGRIVLRWRTSGEGAEFEVEDNGIGIPEHHLPRVTERFYRVDVGRSRASGGTGLGLAIVKHVLNRHDAELRVWSEPGTGSTFTCVFPAARVRRA